MSRRLDQAALDLGREYVRHAPWSAGKRALVENHLNAALRDRPLHRLARTRFGATFAVDTQDLIQRYLYLFGVWEPHMTRWLQRRLKPGDVFVDVGANIGYYSILASRLVGARGKVVAIEASCGLPPHPPAARTAQRMRQHPRDQRGRLRPRRAADVHPRQLPQHGREQRRPL